MKEQYVGDINDYRKYALLRALAAGGLHRLGVCWMLTPSDGSADGNLLSYLTKPERYRAFDPELFDLLCDVVGDAGNRRLFAIEEAGAIPNALYFNAEVPQQRGEREAYVETCRRAFADRDLVFLDPDNGLAVASTAKGRKNSPKYVFLDEIAAFYAEGLSVLIYQHYPHIKREIFIPACAASLGSIASGAELWRFSTSHVLFLLLLHPSRRPSLHKAVADAASRWPSSFIHGEKMSASKSTANLAAPIIDEGQIA